MKKQILLTTLLGLTASAGAWAVPAGLNAAQPLGHGVQTVVVPAKPQKSVLRDSTVVTQGDFTYELFSDDKTARVTAYTGSDTEVTIPNTIEDENETYKVTEIGALFYENTEITSVTLPDSLTAIGAFAFQHCANLTSLTLPAKLQHIGNGALSHCSSLKAFEVSEDNAYFTSEGGVLFDKDKKKLISYPAGKEETTYEVPDGVTEIGIDAFSGSSHLTSVTLPNSVTAIGKYGFSVCTGLTSITLPDSITEIGGCAFQGCSSLTSVTLPNSITEIESNSFENCTALTDITLPNSITKINGGAFYNCSALTPLTLPKNLSYIGDYALSYLNSLEAIEVSEGNSYFSSVDGVLFDKDQKKLISYPAGKKGSSYQVPEGVKEIGKDGFAGNPNLTSITLPNSLSSVETFAFSNCHSLTSMTLPDSVKTIGGWIFNNCGSLESLYLTSKDPSGLTISSDLFFGTTTAPTIYVPASAKEAYAGLFGDQTITADPNISVTITEAKYATYYSDKTYKMPAGLKGAIVTEAQEEGTLGLSWDYNPGDTVPARTALLLKGAQGDYDMSDYTTITPTAVSKATGSFTTGSGTYTKTWTSTATTPRLTLTNDANNMLFDTDSTIVAYVGTTSKKSQDYTISVPEGYKISGFSFDVKNYQNGKSVTVTAGETTVTTTDELQHVEVTGLTGNTAKFNLSGVNNGVKLANFSVTCYAQGNNLLRGSEKDSLTVTADCSEDALYYKLSYDNEGMAVGFYWGNDEGAAFANPAHRCYLALPKAQYALVKGFSLEGDDTVTAITGVNANDSAKAKKIYTLDGLRVNTTSTQGLPAGLYIVDGTKTIVK